MELGVPNFLHPYFHTENSQIGLTNKMKGMMKSVSGKLGRYEHIRNEMNRLSHDIIQEMNEMNLFFVRHPYSETNKKAHYEDEVVNLYGANKRRLVSAGILTTNLTEFTTHKQRKEMNNEKEILHRLSQREALSKDNVEKVYDPRDPEGRIRETQKDTVFKRNGPNSPDISDDDERHDDDSQARYNEYLRGRGLDKLSEYGYHI